MATVQDTLDLSGTAVVPSVLTPGEPAADAILHLLAHMAHSDGVLHEDEVEFLAGILPGRSAESLRAWVNDVGSEPPLLDEVAAAIDDDDMRWTCLRFTARMAWKDGELQDEERTFLEALAEHLGLPRFAVDRVLREMQPSASQFTTERIIDVIQSVKWNAVQIASGRAHTCALRRSGAIACWGANTTGQLGNSAGAAQLKTPAQFPVMVTKVSDASIVDVGPNHGCARLRTGKVVCWGQNDDAQLGSGTASNVWTSRVPARDLASVTALGIGPTHACAASGKRIACWGDNSAGQGGYNGASAPTARVGVTGIDAASLALGRSHTCARLRKGTVACWGSNADGQLGDGGRMVSATPMEVLGL